MTSKIPYHLLVSMIIFITAVDWMGCDIFLPAEPEMLVYFNTDAATLNLALAGYFVVCAVFTLLSGAISDKYGRKPIMILGTLLYSGFSFASALSVSVWMLIICRWISAIGSGIVGAIAVCYLKDSLDYVRFQSANSLVQSATVLGPIVAPFLGAFMIMLGGWRFCLGLLGVLGLISVVMVLYLPETLEPEKRVQGGVVPALKGILLVLKDRTFSLILLLVCFLALPYWALVGCVAYICIDFFEMTYLQYSIWYGGLCFFSFLAPFVYLLLDKKLKNNRLELEICIALLVITVAAVFLWGKISPVLLFVSLVPFVLCEGISRPLSMVVLLELHKETVGAASSVIGFVVIIIGSFGTAIATLPWSNYVTGMAWICAGCLAASLILWVVLSLMKIKM